MSDYAAVASRFTFFQNIEWAKPKVSNDLAESNEFYWRRHCEGGAGGAQVASWMQPSFPSNAKVSI